MVGWLRWGEDRPFFPRVSSERVLGYSLLAVSLPPGDPAKRLTQGSKRLRRRGVRRVLAAPGLDHGPVLARWGLTLVEPTPLFRALGARLALMALAPVPLRDRRVALRGEAADGLCWDLAEVLCPQVGQLLLDFDRGRRPWPAISGWPTAPPPFIWAPGGLPRCPWSWGPAQPRRCAGPSGCGGTPT